MGPKELVCRPWLSITMTCPECAPLGTVTISPRLELRRRAAGELLLMRAPALRGNATTMPAFSPVPPISRVPLIDTCRGLRLHLGAGTHLTLLIRTDSTWGLAATVRALAPAPAPPDLPARAPVDLTTAAPPHLPPAAPSDLPPAAPSDLPPAAPPEPASAPGAALPAAAP